MSQFGFGWHLECTCGRSGSGLGWLLAGVTSRCLRGLDGLHGLEGVEEAMEDVVGEDGTCVCP